MQNKTLLEIKNLKTYFCVGKSVVKAVDDISFNLNKGETTAIVGESGSGKSITSLSIMQLLPTNVIDEDHGIINFDGKNLLSLSEKEMRKIRGNKISMIFQEPMTSLNPVFTVGNQIIEAVQLHQKLDYSNSREKAIEMLELVGIPAPNQRIDEYPHQLSGGMRQRVMIAMSLSCNPEILIADEPTTALDVTIQAQILELIQKLQDELNLAVIMITHDLGVIAEICKRVIVMYAGQVVEEGSIKGIFKLPKHPYTQGLMKSIPIIGGNKNKELYNINGLVPNATEFPEGCHFHPRCEIGVEKCTEELPIIESTPENENHLVRCWEA